MVKNKKAFVLYCDLIHTFDHLTNEQSGEIFKYLLEYVNDKDPEPLNGLLQAVAEPIKQQLKRDLKKYESRAERSRINGKKGGRPKNLKNPVGYSGNPDEPKKPDTDTVTVTVTDTDTDILLKKETKFIFKTELLNFGFEKDLIEDWLKVRKLKKARNTKTAFNGFIREVEKTNLDKNEVLRECCERSWAGFKAEWLNKKNLNDGNSKKGTGDYTDALNEWINS